MLLKLQQYKLNVHYKRGKDLYIADTLSRAYLPLRDDDSLEELEEVQVILPMSRERLEQLRYETQRDSSLLVLTEMIQGNWPTSKSQVISSLEQYWDFKEELAVHDGVLFKKDNVVIPTSLQKHINHTYESKQAHVEQHS
jgi:hypothetical protein